MFLSQNSSNFSKFTFDLPAYGRSFLFFRHQQRKIYRYHEIFAVFPLTSLFRNDRIIAHKGVVDA